MNLPRPAAQRALGVRESRRGLRQALRVLRHPVVPGPQRSRRAPDILAEVADLGVQEVVLVAQDLVSWDRDLSGRGRATPRAAQPGDLGAQELPVW